MHGIQPVFVFEGKPPALKTKTLIKRAQARFNTDINYKLVARRALLKAIKNKNPENENANLEDIDFKNEEDNEELNELLLEIEKIMGENEDEEEELNQKIFIEENKDLIIENEFSLKEFSELPSPIQAELIENWKKERDVNAIKELKELKDIEEASKIQLANFLDMAQKERDMEDFKKELLEKMDKDKIDQIIPKGFSATDLIFRERPEWRKKTILTYFLKERDNKELDEVFRIQKRRKITKQQRLRDLEVKAQSMGEIEIEKHMQKRDFVDKFLDFAMKKAILHLRVDINVQKKEQELEHEILPESSKKDPEVKEFERKRFNGLTENDEALEEIYLKSGESTESSASLFKVEKTRKKAKEVLASIPENLELKEPNLPKRTKTIKRNRSKRNSRIKIVEEKSSESGLSEVEVREPPRARTSGVMLSDWLEDDAKKIEKLKKKEKILSKAARVQNLFSAYSRGGFNSESNFLNN